MALLTEHLKLIPCNTKILEAAILGDIYLANTLGVAVAKNWTEFGNEALQYALQKLSENNDEQGWWTYLPIYKAKNTLIGSGGYKGSPTAEGAVEIGYEIAPEYRNQGLATEMTKALIKNACKYESVKIVLAHTLGEMNPSTKVLIKCGFEKVEELNDPDEGVIWKWKLKT